MAGIYIHIPFCKKRCLYCDFYSNTDMSLTTRYLKAVGEELKLRAHELAGERIDTIYWGGGTPSQLPPSSFNPLFEEINRLFTVAADAEITLEGNPDDLTTEYLTALQQTPFNRISMGVQSFSDADLHFLNRRHTGREAIETVQRCQSMGYTNLSIDLIYGLPSQSLEGWRENVTTAMSLGVPHLSAYSLIYEEETLLYRLWQAGKITPCEDEAVLAMFQLLVDELQRHGYEHYEISNYARPNSYARHNTAYWQGVPYLGLGAAAHSYTPHRRVSNIAHLKHYIEGVESGVLNQEVELLSLDDSYNDLIVTSLRTMWGLPLQGVEQQFGEARLAYCLKAAQPYIDRGLLLQQEGVIKLTEEGVFLSDGIIADLLYV